MVMVTLLVFSDSGHHNNFVAVVSLFVGHGHFVAVLSFSWLTHGNFVCSVILMNMIILLVFFHSHG